MKLADVVGRDGVPAPWAEGDNIPWNEPGFSGRMLKEHLSQSHDKASRRSETIVRHVEGIAREVLGPAPARVLDLGCGPGLYLQALAGRGYECRGIDFSPASVAYARRQAEAAGLSIDYVEADLRVAEFGPDGSFDAVMQIFGELNVFDPAAARGILGKAWAALKPGGRLLAEVAVEDSVRRMGAEPPVWWSAREGLFGEQPHLVLTESFWDEASKTATKRYYRVDAEAAEVTRWASSQQAYSEAEYRELLEGCGFAEVQVINALASDEPGGYCAIVARKPQG
jgi:SAM-dependent methyltransferase